MKFFTFQKELVQRYIEHSFFYTDVDTRLHHELENIPDDAFNALYAFRERVYWERAKHVRYRRTLSFSLKRSNHRAWYSL